MGGNEDPNSAGVAVECHVRFPGGDRYGLEVRGAVDHYGTSGRPQPQVALAEEEGGDVEVGDSMQLAAQVVPYCHWKVLA